MASSPAVQSPAVAPAASFENQIAYRAQKTMGMLGGSPSYEPLEGFDKPDTTSRMYQYSQDGRIFAYVLPASVRLVQTDSQMLLRELEIPNVVEANFSPLGTYLGTWERPLKLEEGAQHKNLRVWNVATGEEVIALTQKSQEGWDLQYTSNESHAIRQVGQEVQVFQPIDWSRGVIDKLRVEGLTSVSLSPGANPSLAVFVGEKKGAPASMRIFSLLTLASPPTSQKTFYKADKTVVKWNKLGTHVLFLTHTDVDKTNKSYYGENNLYMLTAAGTFDCRVTLDKDGPIHDFAWSPNSKEFMVIYGYMPAKATLFDQRVNAVHNFPTGPRNFISFNPQGRLIAVAGFGNLSGSIDVYDRRSLSKVCQIDAPNTTWCEWSPCGRWILTATLSPRLRVDNGIKIWHCTGGLMHVYAVDELYQTSWRPAAAEKLPVFEHTLPVAPPPSSAVLSESAVTPAPPKPAGAYRPPGARGLATPDIYKREDEGGAARLPSNGTSTPPRGTHANGFGGVNGSTGKRGNGQRYVPGAPSPPVGEEKTRRRRKEGGNKKKDASPAPPQEDGVAGDAHVPLTIIPLPAAGIDMAALDSPGEPLTPSDGLDPLAKKIRSLNKKLKAIDELKEKAKRGEKMEMTQTRKMDSEAEVRRELNSLLSGQVAA